VTFEGDSQFNSIRGSRNDLKKKRIFYSKNRNYAKTAGNSHTNIMLIKVALKLNFTFISSGRNGSCHLKK
jgi:hypothetical protein